MTDAQYSALFGLVQGDPMHRHRTIDLLMRTELGRKDGPDFSHTDHGLLRLAFDDCEEKAMWDQTRADARRG